MNSISNPLSPKSSMGTEPSDAIEDAVAGILNDYEGEKIGLLGVYDAVLALAAPADRDEIERKAYSKGWMDALRAVERDKEMGLAAPAVPEPTGPMTREWVAAFPGAAAGIINNLAVQIDAQDCKLAPEGWYCTRKAGHAGPCAAVKATPAAQSAAPAVPESSSITIDFKQATELLEMFGGEPTEITLMTGDGHSGPGLYAVYNADPEGSVHLGETDEDAAPDAPAVQHKTLETMAAEAALEQDPELRAPAVQPEPAGWREALQFYANREHFNLSDESAWDTVTGEPQNFWCDEAGTATVEDGSVAAMALKGTPLPAQSADAVDAKRYRWLRGHWLKLVAVTGRESIDMRAGDEASIDDEEDGCRLDEAIDAALSQSAAHPEGGEA